MNLDNKIKQLHKTFEIRAEIADMMWEIDRLRDVELDYVSGEEYEKASMILEQQKRYKRLIKNREKKLKEYQKDI